MQINRLFEIVYLLLERKSITANELAEHFEVSTRTIYRDIDVLSGANIPIYATQGKGGGIGLLDSFVLDKSILSEEEQNEILFALQSLQKLTTEEEEKTLQKMSALFHKTSKSWIEVDFSSWGKENTHKRKFEKIKQAILSKRVIVFTYFNSAGEETKRRVEPLQIWFKDKAWYVKAYCELKRDYRVFKMARMRDVVILDELFERELPEGMENEEVHIKMIDLKLEIAKEKAYRVYDEFERENITELENGNFLVEVEFPENDWVYEYLLSFGECVKIVAPEYARKRLKKKMMKMIRNYFFL